MKFRYIRNLDMGNGNDFGKFLAEQPTVVYSARNFAKSSFSDFANFKPEVCQCYVVKPIKSILAYKEIVEQGLELLFISSSSSHFLNKTNFEQ